MIHIVPIEDAGISRYYQCDVSNEDEVSKVVGSIESDYGHIDVLANIAGVVLVKPFQETSWEEYRKVVDTNLGVPSCCANMSSRS